MASSSINGFAKGCRALMAAAKSSASATATKAAVVKKSTAPRSGIQKPLPISPALSKFVGAPECSRTEVTKMIWDYIKLNKLQNPANGREIFCDDQLKELFAGKDKIGMLEIAKLLTPHFVKT